MKTLFEILKPEVKEKLLLEYGEHQAIFDMIKDSLNEVKYVTLMTVGSYIILRGLKGCENFSPFDFFEEQ